MAVIDMKMGLKAAIDAPRAIARNGPLSIETREKCRCDRPLGEDAYLSYIFMNISMCIYTHTCICIYMYVCIYLYIYSHTHMHTHTQTHTHTHTHTHIFRCDHPLVEDAYLMSVLRARGLRVTVLQGSSTSDYLEAVMRLPNGTLDGYAGECPCLPASECLYLPVNTSEFLSLDGYADANRMPTASGYGVN